MFLSIIIYTYRRHGSLRKEPKVKTPSETLTKWHELNPTIFKGKPKIFKRKILNLKHNNKQGTREQPCET